ncbi:hypothetical protein KDJ21_005530 [Metabacillus litoralis]|uniref:hypothetical protein n=1 Tax=Metabacillus TaxID=2675233 RepID=UPI000EF598AE|nr:hypothetical protein [Metabacillus litoralis]UHA61125.1 hypothetical protein KDJ21_005530 [Metabacillus litoralis]
MSKNIEIFTDSKRFSNELENQVKDYACSRCSLLVYDASNPYTKDIMESKVVQYGITELPAVTIEGKLVPIEKVKKGSIYTLIRQLLHKKS